MENLKIRVNSEAESKQAKSLLESLGFDIDFSEEGFKYSYLFAYVDEMHVTGDNREDRFKNKNNKEITLPQLRDIVVLKRNDVGDANAFRHDNDVKYYITSDNKYYYFLNILAFRWTESCNDIDYLEKHIKPIEKPMKEYLRKNNDGEYILEVTNEREAQEPHAKHWIEVPSGMNIYWKEDGDYWFTTQVMGYRGAKIIWQRHTHPEELPFIDDEPLQSLNDQYAEIEKVRQSAWQKQEGGSHYKSLKIQPMQYALENKLDYAQANVVKYVTRHKEKNGKEDLLKAIHNIELMIEFYYEGGE